MAFRDGRQQIYVTVIPSPTIDAFASLIKYEAATTEELRSEEVVDARYHGRAVSGSATGDSVWEIVKFDRDGDKEIVRARYLSDVKWDDRATIFP